MNFDELKSRDIKELRLLAAQHGIKTGPRSKAETIAKQIVEAITITPQNVEQVLRHPAEEPRPAVNLNDEETIRETLKTIIAKPGFTIEFPGDNTCIFKCRGAEESIHMSSPLRVIKSKAEGVSRGATRPRGFLDKQTNPTANSGIVMMV